MRECQTKEHMSYIIFQIFTYTQYIHYKELQNLCMIYQVYIYNKLLNTFSWDIYSKLCKKIYIPLRVMNLTCSLTWFSL